MSLLRLSEFVAAKHKIDRSAAKEILKDAFGELLAQASSRGHFVVRGFGTFRWRESKGRKSNLKTGGYIKARQRLTFKQSPCGVEDME